jgi:hypothetical protein
MEDQISSNQSAANVPQVKIKRDIISDEREKLIVEAINAGKSKKKFLIIFKTISS